uniref:Helicase-associated domain-containing protein n=1 Tax=Corethron hystrix TaxID=216773 RepID=A0A7S1FPT5_9STRA|mmetsp:Transcript_18973/g.43238  ORF Transcript_18973/g.43238 Transcript_18973/m.43238 type:complete len:288 (+) Transcript_18973:201-1064(+)
MAKVFPRTFIFFIWFFPLLHNSGAFLLPSISLLERRYRSLSRTGASIYRSRMRLAYSNDPEQPMSSSPHTDIDPLNLPAPDHLMLAQALPYMVDFFEEYGHANIPLGSVDGRRCSTLRRLHHAGKLSPTDHHILSNLNFQFDAFTFDPEEIDFFSLLNRLLKYNNFTNANFQIPKKYAPDPQLGAFVAYVRRMGRDGLDPSWVEALESVNFVWKSLRKCGSSFLVNWRRISEKYEGLDEVPDLNEEDERWVQAQASSFLKGNLSDHRAEYMDRLPVRWRDYMLSKGE